jgi:hypothetical protein
MVVVTTFIHKPGHEQTGASKSPEKMSKQDIL